MNTKGKKLGFCTCQHCGKITRIIDYKEVEDIEEAKGFETREEREEREKEEEKTEFDLIEDLGITSINSVTKQLVFSNTKNNNLVSDIKNVDYIESCTDRFNFLEKTEDLKTFIDSIYGFSYFSKNQIAEVIKSKKLSLKNEDGGSAGVFITNINNCFLNAFGRSLSDTFKNKRITHTGAIDKVGKIVDIVKEQEEKTGYKIKEQFIKIHTNDNMTEEKKKEWDPIGVFKFKVDIPNLDVSLFQENIHVLDNEFFNLAFSFFSIDITRDFINTLNTKAARKHLIIYEGFKTEEELTEIIIKRNKDAGGKSLRIKEIKELIHKETKEKKLAVLVDKKQLEKSAGRNIIKYYFYLANLLIEVKIYNKIVSNFESGGFDKEEGTNLSGTVYSNNNYLMKLFHHEEIKKNGGTRIEITVNGFDKNEMINYYDLMEDEFKRLSKYKFFCKQPIKKQWGALEKTIKKKLYFCQ